METLVSSEKAKHKKALLANKRQTTTERLEGKELSNAITSCVARVQRESRTSIKNRRLI